MASVTTAAAIAGTTAVTAYLDAKLHISQDLRYLYHILLGSRRYEHNVRAKKASAFYWFLAACDAHSTEEAIWSRSGIYTFAQTRHHVCQYGQFFLSLGVRPGDLVALYLQNCPEFLFAWLGLWSIGAAPAMINWNLGGDALLHCLKVSGARIMICDEDTALRERMEGVQAALEEKMGMTTLVLDQELKKRIGESKSELPGDALRHGVTGDSIGALFYTSGTTGPPKGGKYPMSILGAGGAIMPLLFNQTRGPDGDRWYVCMPLYHGTGAISAISAINSGAHVALGKGFSVRNFWTDIRDSQSTIFTYVGETARYLLAAPPSPLDKEHKVRMMWGNGLRPDVWGKFRERFGVPEQAEFFNSTEGMLALQNYCRGEYRTNAVGHHGIIFRLMLRNRFIPVQIDHSTGEIIRDPKTGFAKRAPYDQGGEILVRIPNESAFPGYLNNPQATQKKFARDVFRKGDLFYRSGDALRRTNDGLWFFTDRLGDTFRWKGENVSTADVAEVIGRFPGILEANVYGVLVPHADGRAGCAAIAIAPEQREKFDWVELAAFLRKDLPKYAVPVFLRVVKEVGGSHNNKQNKGPLREEGVDPGLRGKRVVDGGNDEMFWLPPKGDRYVPFSDGDWEALSKETARL